MVPQLSHFFLRPFCASALPAADFDDLLVRPSRSTFDAALAARAEVCFLGAFRCDKALPPADFDAVPVALLRIVFDAAFAAFPLVTFRLVMLISFAVLLLR